MQTDVSTRSDQRHPAWMVDEIEWLRNRLAEAQFDLTERRLGQWEILAAGVALGAMTTGVLTWWLG